MESNDQLVIRTVVPDQGPCHVTLNETKLTSQDAIRLGEQIIAAGRRAHILNQFVASMEDLYIPKANIVQAARKFLERLR